MVLFRQRKLCKRVAAKKLWSQQLNCQNLGTERQLCPARLAGICCPRGHVQVSFLVSHTQDDPSRSLLSLYMLKSGNQALAKDVQNRSYNSYIQKTFKIFKIFKAKLLCGNWTKSDKDLGSGLIALQSAPLGGFSELCFHLGKAPEMEYQCVPLAMNGMGGWSHQYELWLTGPWSRLSSFISHDASMFFLFLDVSWPVFVLFPIWFPMWFPCGSILRFDALNLKATLTDWSWEAGSVYWQAAAQVHSAAGQTSSGKKW